ncbi:MAG: hypothetical protein MRY21_06230 [Simkaniaceae bacterium]|nr:hypothetical protein [Simkaniaceae bacterium]
MISPVSSKTIVEGSPSSIEISPLPRPSPTSLEGACLKGRIHTELLTADHPLVTETAENFLSHPLISTPLEEVATFRSELIEIARGDSGRRLLNMILSQVQEKSTPLDMELSTTTDSTMETTSQSTFNQNGVLLPPGSMLIKLSTIKQCYFYRDEFGVKQITPWKKGQLLFHELVHALIHLVDKEREELTESKPCAEEYISKYGVSSVDEFHTRAERDAILGYRVDFPCENDFVKERGGAIRVDHNSVQLREPDQINEINFLQTLTTGPLDAAKELMKTPAFLTWFAKPENQFKAISQSNFGKDHRIFFALRELDVYTPEAFPCEQKLQLVTTLILGVEKAQSEFIERLYQGTFLTDLNLPAELLLQLENARPSPDNHITDFIAVLGLLSLITTFISAAYN